MSSAYSNTSYANLGEISPINNSGENSFDVNDLPPSYGSHLVPIYYPIPTYYQIYYGVSSVESNGTTFYQYYPFAVPIYCFPSDLTTESINSGGNSVSYTDELANEIVENVNEDSLSSEITAEYFTSSDVSSMSDDPDDFYNEIFENVNEDSYSDQFTPSSTNGNDVASNDPPEELIDEFTEYYDEARVSSIFIPENDFIAEDRKNDIKRKKDWLYLLSLSGKLHVKDHIPQVHVMPEIIEEDENVETSQEIFESGDSLEEELWTDVIPEIDKSDGDQKNPNEDEIESSYADGAHKEKCQASGEENDLWKDFFYSMDDPVFGIEACFSNSSEKEPSDYDLDKKNFNLPSTCGKTFIILPRLNKQIEILPTIEEEGEDVVKSENLHVVTEMPPVEINKDNIKSFEEGCLKPMQQNAEVIETSCGVSEAIKEVDHSQKPTKKRFKRIRRYFTELRSCFRKIKDPAG